MIRSQLKPKLILWRLCRCTDPGESRGAELLPLKRADSQRDQ